jgi:hypothetical protein
VCNGVAVIGYGVCNGCNRFETYTVKIDFDIAEYAMVSRHLKLQSDHKDRLQSTSLVRVLLKFTGVLIDPKHPINWVMIRYFFWLTIQFINFRDLNKQ